MSLKRGGEGNPRWEYKYYSRENSYSVVGKKFSSFPPFVCFFFSSSFLHVFLLFLPPLCCCWSRSWWRTTQTSTQTSLWSPHRLRALNSTSVSDTTASLVSVLYWTTVETQTAPQGDVRGPLRFTSLCRVRLLVCLRSGWFSLRNIIFLFFFSSEEK